MISEARPESDVGSPQRSARWPRACTDGVRDLHPRRTGEGVADRCPVCGLPVASAIARDGAAADSHDRCTRASRSLERTAVLIAVALTACAHALLTAAFLA